MVSPSLVGAFAVLVPAMALMWFYLRNYEGHFDERKLFFALVVGLFAGTAVKFLEVQFFPFDNPRLIQGGSDPYTTGTLVYSFAYTVFGLALLESLGKTGVLGFRKFRMAKDTAYHGVALGVGFGAMWTLQFFTSQVARLTYDHEAGAFRTDAVSLLLDALIFVLSMGFLLAHVASAVWVGHGASTGRLWKGAVLGTLWLAPALAFYWLSLNGGMGLAIPAGAALGWGAFAMWWADRRILQPLIPPEVREATRRQRRREARKVALGEPAKPK